MLVSFTVQNYRSIYKPVTLDLRIKDNSKEKELELDNNPYVHKINDEYISKLGLLYGHNGSGKSNILLALGKLLLSFFPIENNNNILKLADPHLPYRENEPSIFKIVFYSNLFPLKDSEKRKDLQEFDIHQERDLPYKKYQYELQVGLIDTVKNDFGEIKKIQISYEKFECLTDSNIFFERKGQKITSNKARIFSKQQDIPIDTLSLVFLSKFPKKEKKSTLYRMLFWRLFSSSSDFATMSDSYRKNPGNYISGLFETIEKEDLLEFYQKILQLADVGLSHIVIEAKTRANQADILYKQIQKIEERMEVLEPKENKLSPKEKKEYGRNKNILDAFILLYKVKMDETTPKEELILYSLRTKLDGTIWKREFNEIESDGTKMLAGQLVGIVFALKYGGLVIEDELLGIQSDLITTIISLFQLEKFEDSHPNSQLLMSTHDTLQMSKGKMLLDFFWILDKEEDQTVLRNAAQIEELTIEKLMTAYITNKIGGKYYPQYHLLPDRIQQ